MRVPIVFSTNNIFVYPCYVAIYSLIEYSNNDNLYDIKILHTELTEENIILLKRLERNNIRIDFIDMKDIIADKDLRETLHLSIETYYRLFIPSVIKEYDKILYLDSDILVLKDVAFLYNADLHGHILAGVDDVYGQEVTNHEKRIGIKDGYHSINAGVVIMDVKQFREKDVCNRALELLYEDYGKPERKYLLADQDLLNVLLVDDIERLDPRWNFMWRYMWEDHLLDKEYKKQYMLASKEPWIIHYAGAEKPWKNPARPFADIYWEKALRSPMGNRFMYQSYTRLSQKFEEDKHEFNLVKRNKRLLDKYRFPYDRIPYGSKIILYGAGKLGAAVYELLNVSHYASSVIWTDSNTNGNEHRDMLSPLEEIVKECTGEEYFLITVGKSEAADEIREKLKEVGIQDEFILWFCDNKDRSAYD